MVVAYKLLLHPQDGLLGRHRGSDLFLLIYYGFFWVTLALPAVFASTSIWVASRRDLTIPPAASMTVIFGAVATVYYFLVKGANDWNVVIQTLIGFHGVLILVSVPIIRWWRRRSQSR